MGSFSFRGANRRAFGRLIVAAVVALAMFSGVVVGSGAVQVAASPIEQVSPAVVDPAATTPVRIEAVTLATGENTLVSGVSDGTHAYFGTDTAPGRVVKVRLSTMKPVATLTLNAGEDFLRSAVSDGTHAYFGTNTSPGRVVKVRLSDMTRVGALTLGIGENNLTSAVSDAFHAYFGTDTAPGRVVKVRLSNVTRVGALTLGIGENNLTSAVTDGTSLLSATHAYFGTGSSPGRVVKVRLSDVTRVSAVTLNAGENNLRSAVSDGTFAHFGTSTSPGRVVKVRLSDVTRVSAVTLNVGENNLRSAVTDETFAYFGTLTSPGRVVKVRLSDMTRLSAVTLNTGENSLQSAVTDGVSGYFGTTSSPGRVVKVELAPPVRGSIPGRTGAATLATDENVLRSAVTDGSFAYYGTNTSPGRVVKVRLSDMTRVGAVTLNTGENFLQSAVTDGVFGYFGTFTVPSVVVKVRLSDMTRVGAVTLGTGSVASAVTDGEFGYFGSFSTPGDVTKVRLSDMTEVGSLSLNAGENLLSSAVTDGVFGYFGTETSPGRVVKIRLSDMTRVGAVTLNAGEENLLSAVTDGTFGYFGTNTTPGRVVKVRLSDMSRVGAATFNAGENGLFSAVGDGAFGYFGTGTSPGRVVKVRLSDMTRVGPVTLNAGENGLFSAVTDGSFGYFGTNTSPGRVVKVQMDPPSVPGAPRNVVGTAGNGQVTVSWAAPTSDGGSPVTGYRVTGSPGGSTCSTVAPVVSCVVSGLSNGTGYTFSVVASNIAGPGAASAASGSVTPRTVPGAPRNVVGTAGNGQVTVSWAAPTSDGGSPVTGYRVTGSPGGSTCSTVAPVVSCVVSGLSNGTAYTFSVVASNIVGPGAASAASGSVTPRTVPGAPRSVVATAGNGQVTVSWAAPTSDGGSPVTGYRVTGSLGVTVCSTVAPVVSCLVSGLSNDQSYSFTVYASNQIGEGTSSASVSATPVVPSSPPGQPGIWSVQLWFGTATVFVSQPLGGSAPERYVVSVAPGDATCEIVVPLTSCVVSGLSETGLYRVTAVATNSAGSSPQSQPFVVVTPGAGSPTPQFDDVEAGRFFTEATSMLKLRGITTGISGTNNFRPSGQVTRAEMATFLYRMAGEPSVAPCTFIDQAQIPGFARTGACWLKAENITTNDPFNPNGLVNRAQMAAFMFRFAYEPPTAPCTFIDQAQIPVFARTGACWLKANGITTNDPYNPAVDVTRAQMAAFLYRTGGTLGYWISDNVIER